MSKFSGMDKLPFVFKSGEALTQDQIDEAIKLSRTMIKHEMACALVQRDEQVDYRVHVLKNGLRDMQNKIDGLEERVKFLTSYAAKIRVTADKAIEHGTDLVANVQAYNISLNEYLRARKLITDAPQLPEPGGPLDVMRA